MEEVNSNSESFSDFIEEVKEIPELEIEEQEQEGEGGETITNINTKNEMNCCPYCPYIPRSHCKDKAKSILNHIKKKHPEKLNDFLQENPNSSIEVEKKDTKKSVSNMVQEIENCSKISESVDEKKLRICADLDVIQAKFPHIWKGCPTYSYPESSVESLERIKSTYTKLINDKLTSKLAFNTLIALSKGAERVSDSLGVCDLDGYAYNVQQNEEELIPIIDELISSNVLDMSQITPDIKIAICLLNIGIRTAESNKVKSHLNSQS